MVITRLGASQSIIILSTGAAQLGLCLSTRICFKAFSGKNMVKQKFEGY